MTGSDFSSAFAPWYFICAAAFLLMPLGLWKLVEIIIWVYHHVHFGIS
jgi:uncharacterized membrane protein